MNFSSLQERLAEGEFPPPSNSLPLGEGGLQGILWLALVFIKQANSWVQCFSCGNGRPDYPLFISAEYRFIASSNCLLCLIYVPQTFLCAINQELWHTNLLRVPKWHTNLFVCQKLPIMIHNIAHKSFF